jgi:hypothetical protein
VAIEERPPIWIGQIVLAAVFFIAGVAKLLAYRSLIATLEHRCEQRCKTAPIQSDQVAGAVVGLLEIAADIGVILPPAWNPDAVSARVRADPGVCLQLLEYFQGPSILNTRS